MSDFSTLEVTRDPRGFATLWMSREDKNNAFNAQMIRELIVAVDRLGADPSLRFVLLRGPAAATQVEAVALGARVLAVRERLRWRELPLRSVFVVPLPDA